jgi:transcriptional regulator with XRE-family HTH domain
VTLQQYLAKAFTAVLEGWKTQYERGVRLRALRKRRHWRKADISRLLDIGVKSAAQRRMSKIWKGKDKPGRGVVSDPKSFLEATNDVLTIGKRLADPATPALERRELYKKTPWWPDIIEAAYRGELEKAKGNTTWRHLRASEVAKDEVAEAAGITPAHVHQLCHQVRAKRGDAPADEPATSAAELKQHLENGPDLARLGRISKTPRV